MNINIENAIKSINDLPSAYMEFTDIDFSDGWKHFCIYSDGPQNELRINGKIAEIQESAYIDVYTRIKNDSIINTIEDALDTYDITWSLDSVSLDNRTPAWLHYSFTVWE